MPDKAVPGQANGIARDRRPRSALLLPDFGGGGAERVALALIDALLTRGFAVDLVLGNAVGCLLPLVPPEVEIVDLKAPRLRQAIAPMARYLRTRRPVALHAMMWPMPLLAVGARLLAQMPTRIVASEHGMLSVTPFALSRRLVRALTRRAYLMADAIVAVSGGCADDVAGLLAIPRDRIEVVHNPLLLPSRLPDSVAARSCWAPAASRLLAVGELKEEKNYSLLFHAIALLRERRAVSLVILGDGAYRRRLEQLGQTLGLTDIVAYAGFVNDPWPFYAAADLFVLSSDAEAFGNVLVEALHAGLRIVSTDCAGGPREILANGRFGSLVPCGDAVALAEAIAEAIDRPVDRAALQARAAALSGEDAVERHVQLMIGAG